MAQQMLVFGQPLTTEEQVEKTEVVGRSNLRRCRAHLLRLPNDCVIGPVNQPRNTIIWLQRLQISAANISRRPLSDSVLYGSRRSAWQERLPARAQWRDQRQWVDVRRVVRISQPWEPTWFQMALNQRHFGDVCGVSPKAGSLAIPSHSSFSPPQRRPAWWRHLVEYPARRNSGGYDRY